jgi:AAA domain-containing protein
MTTCDICGSTPCATPVFCRECRDRDAQRHKVQRTWRDGIITAKALQTKIFPAVRIILPDLIPEGVTILAGKPKIGKSWFLLDVCIAVAGDRFVLGEIKPVQGDVLYLALEDNLRRLKKRTDKIMQGAASWPELDIHTEWRRVDQGGLDDMREWCEAHPARRLICIDTLAKLRPIAGKNEQSYGFDYRTIEGLQKLAGEYQIGIVLSHHLRKASSEDDVFDDVSGTLGLTGAADAIVIMKRHAGMMKVFVRGRDIEESEFAAEFNRNTCRWRIVGGADEVFRSQERQKILAVLKDAGTDKDGNPKSMSVAQIMAATERTDRQAMYALLWKMQQAGEIVSVGRGLYALPGKDPLSSVEIVEKEPFETDRLHEAADNGEVSGTNESQRESQRNLNGSDSVEIPFRSTKASNPLAGNGSLSESQHLNDLNSTYRVDDYPEFPDCLRRSPSVTAPSSTH